MNIPFNVSARMALLIGRESIPSSNGAIGEIVKNAYDADASEVTVVFDVPYINIPEEISADLLCEMKQLYSKKRRNRQLILECLENSYVKIDELYHLVKPVQDLDIEILYSFFKSFNRITFIDNGEGMNSEIIEKYWMTIGTHNKLANSKTKSGRNKVGSKGIGRFSLDKLGERCSMKTKDDDNSLVEWIINWNDFEQEDAKITDVEASLSEYDELEYSDVIKSELNESYGGTVIPYFDYQTGTFISIDSLRERWDRERLTRLKSDLLSLIPINIFNPFRIFFVSKQYPELSEEIKRPLLADYDYRVKFECINGEISVDICRAEFNYKLMNPDLTELILSNLKKRYRGYSVDELSIKRTKFRFDLNDIQEGDIDNYILSKIGDFSFEFDYFKLTPGNDSKKYFYKSFNTRDRKIFMEENSGVKLYRDGFRVRPYGEKDSFSYDWLGLGIKATSNPASMTHKGGNWYIRPNQIFGRVNISRDTNPKLLDNASRQGIDQSEEFETFVQLIKYLIGIFEKDRVEIATSILKYNKDDIEKKEKEEEVKRTIKKIEQNKVATNEEAKNIVESYKQKEEEIKALNYELNILKSYSTSSMFTRVFTHEINHVNNNLVSRIDQMKPMMDKIVNKDLLKDAKDKQNPYLSLISMKNDIKVLDSYIAIMTSNSIKDKRKRTATDMFDYFSKFEKNWTYILSARDIKLNMDYDKFTFKCFDFDIFSIVTNLIINSSEAFLEEQFSGERVINISAKVIDEVFVFNYGDTGPGLNKQIKNPYDIFDKEFSTKKNGNGIGMWILQTLVNEYAGELSLKDVTDGFNLEIVFPKGVRLIG